MEQPPASQPDFIPQYFRTRSEILQTIDPINRLVLMEVAIAEGDRGMAVHALETLRDLPDTHPDVPDRLNPDKFTQTILLTEALLQGGLVQEAEGLVASARDLDFELGVEVIDTMLWHGHTGPDGAYLTLGPEMIGWVDIPERKKLQYAAQLAAYGQDIFDPHSDAYGLFEDCLPPKAPQHEVDHRLLQICRAYARTGQFDRAEACIAAIRNPYWEKEAELLVAAAAQVQGQDDVARTWLARGMRLNQVAECDPSCGRPSCNPPVDVKVLSARAAPIFARRGDFTTAISMAGEADTLTMPEHREVYVTHYEQTGSMASRETAIQAITAVTDLTVEKQVERLFHADIAWGNTLPSLEAADETIPLICWELHEMYSRLSIHEERLQSPEGELERMILEHLFNVPISEYLEENAATREALRDRLLADMVRRTAPTAPHTAYAMLQLITTNAERVRAVIAVGRQQGYEGFFKREPEASPPPPQPEKKPGALEATSDMVLHALRRLLETFRHPPKDPPK